MCNLPSPDVQRSRQTSNARYRCHQRSSCMLSQTGHVRRLQACSTLSLIPKVVLQWLPLPSSLTNTPVLPGLQQHSPGVVGQDNPWDFVQDAFRRLADPGADSGPPLTLDTLMSGRPALLDKVTSWTLTQKPCNTLCASGLPDKPMSKSSSTVVRRGWVPSMQWAKRLCMWQTALIMQWRPSLKGGTGLQRRGLLSWTTQPCVRCSLATHLPGVFFILSGKILRPSVVECILFSINCLLSGPAMPL